MVTVEAGTVCRPRPGRAVSGDRIGIWRDEASTLVTVIDGLGSGQAAAQAAQIALACVEMNRDQPLRDIVVCCHEVLQATRGAVMALARVQHDRDRLSFVGVGNIGFSAASARPMQPVSPNGLLGHRLPSLLEYGFDCTPGDLVVLYSDGISSRFVLQGGVAALNWVPPQELAQRIVKRFAQDDDVAVAVLMMVGTTDQSSIDLTSILQS
jgi:negative regulator of sigma-B (phosphoserine phosphatase)